MFVRECGSEVICDEAAVSKIQVLEVLEVFDAFEVFEVFETVMKAEASVNFVVFLAVSSFLSF
jgi:hypothetical protein